MMNAYSKSPSFDLGENIEKCEERVGDYLETFQKLRGGSTKKGHSSTPPLHNNCIEGMQTNLGVDGGRQLIEFVIDAIYITYNS